MQHRLKTSLVTAVLLLLLGCQPAPPEESASAADEPGAAAEPAGDATEPGVVEVTLEDFAFNAPASLPSGWTTFRMTNEGEQPHFMIFWKLPDAVEFEQYAEFGRMFQGHYDAYFAGEATQEEMLGNIMAGLPEWFADVQAMGGVALTSPGITAQTTIRLEPGEYVMECYVVTPEGRFHGSEGMLRPLVVTEETTGLEPPTADITVTLSNYEMQVDGDLTAGEHVVAVHATEQAEGIILHDVNVARLDEDTSIEEVGSWMSWIDALRNPSPATFLGGADHLAAGATGYFRISLDPGRYAFVSEGFASQGMVHEFTVE